jgi:ribosome-associated protein
LKVVAAKGAAEAPIEEMPASRAALASPADLSALSGAARAALLQDIVLKGLDDDKAEDIVTIPLAGKSDIADAMIVASGRSQRHVGALADNIVRKLKDHGFGRARVEGAPACDWVLIDAEDVIVHIFRPEVRRYYNLERIWSEAAHAPAGPDA